MSPKWVLTLEDQLINLNLMESLEMVHGYRYYLVAIYPSKCEYVIDAFEDKYKAKEQLLKYHAWLQNKEVAIG